MSIQNQVRPLQQNNPQPLVFVVFGPQGCGKSTQVERLAQRLQLTVFEAGKVLRESATPNTDLHRNISQGFFIADEAILKLVERFIADHRSASGYVLDGFPRNLSQFNDLVSLSKKYRWTVTGIFIDLSDESSKKRLASRWQIINGQRVVREDDKPQIVQKRLDTFKRETLPLKERFKEVFTLLEIDGEPSVDKVTTQINVAVDEFLQREV